MAVPGSEGEMVSTMTDTKASEEWGGAGRGGAGLGRNIE